MSETIIGVVIGGIIGILGGFIQNWFSYKNQNKLLFKQKREEAYLDFIYALTELKVDYRMQIVYNKFFEKYNSAMAKVKLYGSQDLLNNCNSYMKDLENIHEEYGGLDIDEVVLENKEKIIEAIRNELKIV